MKKKILSISMLLIGLGVCSAVGYTAQNNKPMPSATAPATTPLTADQQKFAAQLSQLHKQIFSTVFTTTLRQEAMDIYDDPNSEDEDGNAMTPDMCVEEVLKNHRDMSSMPQGSAQQNMPQSKGSAPSQSGTSTNKNKSYWN